MKYIVGLDSGTEVICDVETDHSLELLETDTR